MTLLHTQSKFSIVIEAIIQSCLVFLVIALCFFGSQTYAATATFAVATNFTDAMKQIVHDFEQQHANHRIQVSYASSGKLYAQILHGAPFDAFLSADADKPTKLIQKNLGLDQSQFTYAQGQLALWAPGITLNQAKSHALLKAGEFKHLALANAKLAPYGMAAIEVLKSFEVYSEIAPKLVQGENVGQTYQFIQSGNAKLGFIAFSQLIKTQHTEAKDYWLVDAALYKPIQQDAILLTHGKKNAAALAFMKYLRSQQAKTTIQSFGYLFPDH